MLLLFPLIAKAQLQIKKNSNSKFDTIVVMLPYDTKMFFVVDNINKLQLVEETNLDSLIRALNIQIKAHQTLTFNAVHPEKSVPRSLLQFSQKDSGESEKPYLIIWTGLGAGMIGKKFVPQFNPSLSLRKNNKDFSIGMDFLFYLKNENFDSNKSVEIKPFINLGYGFKVAQKSGGFDFHRVSVGYLVPTNQHESWRPSFKMSYLYPVARTAIKLIPEVYFFNFYGGFGFAQIYPGISIRF